MKTLKSFILLGSIIFLISSCKSDTATVSDERSFREWYMPNGIFTSRGTTPETSSYDVTGYAQEWIHILNMGKRDATVKVTFFTENAPPKDTVYNVKAGQGQPFNIDESKLQKMVKINTLYGLRVASDEDVILQVTRFESEATPAPEIPGSNQIHSTIAYPGPLGQKEKRWIYVDCWALTHNDFYIEKEWLNILNPSKKDAEINLTFIDRRTGLRTHSKQVVKAERIFTLDLVTLPPDVFKDQSAISVLVESSEPVVTMQIRRFFHTKDKAPRGIVANIAYPVGDRDVLK